MEKIDAGEKDKETNGPFLIQLAFNARTLPIIGEVPTLAPVEIPTMLIKPPTVISFESNNNTCTIENINLQWLDSMSSTISSLSEMNRNDVIDEYRANLKELDEYAELCSKKYLIGYQVSYVPEFLLTE